MISVPVLIAAGVLPTQAKQFAGPLAAASVLYDISTKKRQSAFIAHCIVESINFTKLEEDLFHTRPSRVREIFKSTVPSEAVAMTLVRNPKALANHVYAGRNGNGDKESGDGWRFRGRGLFQLTGRRNYERATAGVRRDYLSNPGLVAQPEDAALTAAWYWYVNGCNVMVDEGRFDATTRAINGPGMLHAAERRKSFEATQLAFATGSLNLA